MWIGLSLLAAGCMEKQSDVQPIVERGKYLVTIGGCHDCHTPKVPGPDGAPVLDEKRLLAGHPEGEPFPTWNPADLKQRNAAALTNPELTAWAGPWGVTFAINLTPDNATGIGEWSETNFVQALRTGKHQGQPNGRNILPPMPWQNTRAMTDEDLKALYAYLRSIPAVKNQVPMLVLPKQAVAEAKS
jgi:mono/diheme cytochrome c family protein